MTEMALKAVSTQADVCHSIDVDRYVGLISTVGDEMQAILEEFRGEGDDVLQQFGKGADSLGSELMHRLAHRLKGSSSLLGAVSLARLCAQLEDQCSEAATGQVSELVNRIRIEYSSSLSLLQRIFDENRKVID